MNRNGSPRRMWARKQQLAATEQRLAARRQIAERSESTRYFSQSAIPVMQFTISAREVSEALQMMAAAVANLRKERTKVPDSPVTVKRRTPPRPQVPRIKGKVIAYRCWSLDGYRLRSANWRQHGMHWELGPNQAECRIKERMAYLVGRGEYPAEFYAKEFAAAKLPPHDAPHPLCECGLYGYFEPFADSNTFPLDECVWGAIAAWGKIEVHHSGIRAQYAEPIALCAHPDQSYDLLTKASALASEACIPFVSYNMIRVEASKHGQEVPCDLRPGPFWDRLLVVTAQRATVIHACPVEGNVEVSIQLLESVGWKCPICRRDIPRPST